MITLVLIVTATIFFYFYFKQKYSYFKQIGVPGPSPVPFLGTYFAENELNGKEIEKKFFKQYGSVYGTYFGTVPVLNTSDPDHIKQVLNDVNTFQHFGLFQHHDKYLSKGLVFLNGQKWKDHRRAMSGHFTSRRLKQLISHFEIVSDNFLKNIEFIRETKNTEEINVKDLAKFYAVDMISKYVFAVDVNSYKQYMNDSEFAKLAFNVGNINLGQIILGNFIPLSLFKIFQMNIFDHRPMEKLGDLFKKMIKERDPTLRYEDLSELLQDAINENKVEMSEDEVIANCILGFFAGTDTTSMALTNVFYFLIEYPEYKTKLYEEIQREFSDGISYEKLMASEYLDAFVSESLRLGQSLLALDKVAVKDTVLEKGNYKIKKGTVIFLITYLAHIDEKNFPEPQKFDPNRFLDKSPSNKNQIHNGGCYLPFSVGQRQCIGMRFALLEIKYLIVRVLLEYDLQKPKDFKLEVISRRRFCFPLRMQVIFKKRTLANKED